MMMREEEEEDVDDDDDDVERFTSFKNATKRDYGVL
jgi:hypothetical protein